MVMSMEDVRAKFTIKTIPNIIGDPTYKAVNELREALYANKSAISTMLEGRAQWTHQVDHGRSSVCEPVRYGIHNTNGAGLICKIWGQ